MGASLLHMHDLRIDAGGVPCVDGLALRIEGTRALVLGGPRELFEATCGARARSRGSLLVQGTDAADALRAGHVAGAPLDPPLPPAWSALRYVTWSARLAGHTRSDAVARAEDALKRLGAHTKAASPLKAAPTHLRRATVIAAALATGAHTFVLEDPLAGLAEPVADAFAATLLDALGANAWIVFAGRTAADAPFATRADVAVVLHGSRVAAQGRPRDLAAATSVFSLRVAGDGGRFAEIAGARGARVTPTGDAHGGDALFTVELEPGAASTRMLFDVAHEAESVIVELCPIARAFA